MKAALWLTIVAIFWVRCTRSAEEMERQAYAVLGGKKAADTWRNAARSNPKAFRARELRADLLLCVNEVLGGRSQRIARAAQLGEKLAKLDADSYERWRLEGALAASAPFKKALPKSPAANNTARLA